MGRSAPPTAPADRDDQLDLFAEAPEWARLTDLDRRFWRFHDAHPEVYAQLLGMARRAVARGRTRASIAQMFEVLRWERFIEHDDAEDFRLNNDFRSRYARLLMEREPDLAGLFATRKLTA